MRKIVTLVILMMALTACGKQGVSIHSQIQESANSQVTGTNGQLIPIQSENVLAAGYDGVTMIMTVQFNNGALYEYYGVPANLWTTFVAAQPHPWSQVGYPRLVRGGIPYKRIG